ncbi:MAG TPA: hypothetical protein VM580_29310 [Labilithrix sp.]|nr:hypothetical protein [Labilithrix sp.]
MSEKKKFGRHEIGYEADTGFVSIVLNGTLGESDAAEIISTTTTYEQTFYLGQPTFMIVDTRKAGGVTSEARKYMASSGGQNANQAFVVIFGGSFAIRTMMNLVFKAVEFASSTKLTAAALSTEAEARTWLSDQKRAFLARSPATPRA